MNTVSFFPKQSVISSIVLVLLILIGQSCQDQEVVKPGKGKLVISFATADSDNSGGRTNEDDARPHYVMVSLTDEDGNSQNLVRLKLVGFGNGYVSENLELAAGKYRLTEFFVLDEFSAIYSTPREGSPLASLVQDPLDIEFVISDDENTNVTPEVLAIEENVSPGDFGYASFGFKVVDVTALILPETTENIVKVSYEFIPVMPTYIKPITGEAVPLNRMVKLNHQYLRAFVNWNSYITVWTEPKECTTQFSDVPYQKVYRLSTELAFNGAPIQLPELSSKRWDAYYYRAQMGSEFFFSANPLKSYNIEIHVPADAGANYSWADRLFWNSSGQEVCEHGEASYSTVQMDDKIIGRMTFEDRPLCETADLHIVDTFVAINSDIGPMISFFSWTIVNGVPIPSCDVSENSSGRKAIRDRIAPPGF